MVLNASQKEGKGVNLVTIDSRKEACVCVQVQLEYKLLSMTLGAFANLLTQITT